MTPGNMTLGSLREELETTLDSTQDQDVGVNMSSILQGSLTPVATPESASVVTRKSSFHRRSSSDSFIMQSLQTSAIEANSTPARAASPPAALNHTKFLQNDMHVLSRPPIDPVKDLQLLDVLDALDYVVPISDITTDPDSYVELSPGFLLGPGHVCSSLELAPSLFTRTLFFLSTQFLNFDILISKFKQTQIPRFPEQVEAVEPCLLEVAENLGEVRRLTNHENLAVFLGLSVVSVRCCPLIFFS